MVPTPFDTSSPGAYKGFWFWQNCRAVPTGFTAAPGGVLLCVHWYQDSIREADP